MHQKSLRQDLLIEISIIFSCIFLKHITNRNSDFSLQKSIEWSIFYQQKKLKSIVLKFYYIINYITYN